MGFSSFPSNLYPSKFKSTTLWSVFAASLHGFFSGLSSQVIISPSTFPDSDDISGDNPFNSVVERIKYPQARAGSSSVCDVVGYDAYAAYATMEMPGTKKEGVKVWVDKYWAMHIKGEGGHKVDDEQVKDYYSVLKIPKGVYEKEKIRALWKDEELFLLIPKVLPRDKEGVLHVEVKSIE